MGSAIEKWVFWFQSWKECVPFMWRCLTSESGNDGLSWIVLNMQRSSCKVLRLVLTVSGLVAEVLHSTNVCLHMVHQDLIGTGWNNWNTNFLWSLELFSQLVVSISRIISKKVRFLLCFAYFFILHSKIINLRIHNC